MSKSEKEKYKSALKKLAKSQNKSLSNIAVEAGIAPSTITGFMNDVVGRGKYGLSAKTRSKLSETFQEFISFVNEVHHFTEKINCEIEIRGTVSKNSKVFHNYAETENVSLPEFNNIENLYGIRNGNDIEIYKGKEEQPEKFINKYVLATTKEDDFYIGILIKIDDKIYLKSSNSRRIDDIIYVYEIMYKKFNYYVLNNQPNKKQMLNKSDIVKDNLNPTKSRNPILIRDRLLRFLKNYLRQNGFSPTRKEMERGVECEHSGLDAAIKSLERDGLIIRLPGHHRNIKPV
jgi:transcriptional regulator with XRE-family HTH domain